MKKVIVGLGIVLSAFASQASYLWFTVQNGMGDGYNNVTGYLNELKTGGKISSSDDVYAKVWAVNDSTKTSLGTAGFTSEWQLDEKGNNVSLGDLVGSGYSYYIEICSTATGYSSIGYNTQATTYDALVAGGQITDSMVDVPKAEIWHGGSGAYKATPEPTSAVLMLLGVAGLALRRKQRTLA